MRRHGDLQTATQCRAMNHGHHGLAAGLDTVADIGQERLDRRLAEFADIGTGDESLALTHDDHGLDRSAGIGLLHGRHQTLAHGSAQRIDGRIVDADEQDVTVLLEFNDRSAGFGGHACLLNLFMEWALFLRRQCFLTIP